MWLCLKKVTYDFWTVVPFSTCHAFGPLTMCHGFDNAKADTRWLIKQLESRRGGGFWQGLETHPSNLPISVEQNQVLVVLERLSQSDLREASFLCGSLGLQILSAKLSFPSREAINTQLQSIKSPHLLHNSSLIKAGSLFKARLTYLTLLQRGNLGHSASTV